MYKNLLAGFTNQPLDLPEPCNLSSSLVSTVAENVQLWSEHLHIECGIGSCTLRNYGRYGPGIAL